MKFYERLESWSYLLRSKALYHELKYYVKKKQTHIKRLYHFNSRGIGKAYNLMKISGKYKIPLIESNIMSAKLACECYRKFQPIVITPIQLEERVKHGSLILVDERQLFSNNDKKALQKYICIGFEAVFLKKYVVVEYVDTQGRILC